MAEQKIIDRIIALYTKAQRTEFEGERDAYLAKAAELQSKHDLSAADLVGTIDAKHIKEIVPVAKATAFQNLFAVAAGNHDCVVLSHRTGQGHSRRSTGNVIIVGTPDDVKLTQALYASLLVQMEGDLGRAVKPFNEHGRTFNNSFRQSFTSRIAKRLKALRDASTASVGTELVLRDKKAATALAVRELVGKTRTSSATTYRGSAAGIAAGQRAADRARLGQTGISASRKVLA